MITYAIIKKTNVIRLIISILYLMERAELIDGQLYYMAPPSRKHRRIITELSNIINNYIKANDGLFYGRGCRTSYLSVSEKISGNIFKDLVIDRYRWTMK